MGKVKIAAGLALAAATAIGLAACKKEGAAETAGPIAKPERKAGLWEQTSTIQGAPPQVLRICADKTVENSLPWWGRVAQVGSCTDKSGKRNADGSYAFEAVCELGAAGKSGITGTGSGDFNSKYQVKVQMITAGAARPELNGRRELTNSFEWKGDCPADWRVGDVEVPGGMRMNYDPNQVAREIAAAQAALKAQEQEQKAADEVQKTLEAAKK